MSRDKIPYSGIKDSAVRRAFQFVNKAVSSTVLSDAEVIEIIDTDATHGDDATHSYYTNSDVDAHLSGGVGISYSAGTITNTDTGSDAVSSHETTYDHTAFLTGITGEPIGDLSDVVDTTPTDADVLVYDGVDGQYENRALTESDISDLTHYTNSDVEAYLSATSPVTYSSGVIALTTGISDGNAVVIDDLDAADNDFARLTASGIEGRSASEVKTDLSLNNVPNEDATDMVNWDQKEASDGQAPIWDGDAGRWSPTDIDEMVFNGGNAATKVWPTTYNCGGAVDTGYAILYSGGTA